MKSYVPEQPPAALSSVDRDCLFLTKPYRRATHPGYLSPLLEAARRHEEARLAKIESHRIKSTEVASREIRVIFFFGKIKFRKKENPNISERTSFFSFFLDRASRFDSKKNLSLWDLTYYTLFIIYVSKGNTLSLHNVIVIADS